MLRKAAPGLVPLLPPGACASGLWHEDVCCARQCGVCDSGTACQFRPGGRSQCCPHIISQGGLWCDLLEADGMLACRNRVQKKPMNPNGRGGRSKVGYRDTRGSASQLADRARHNLGSQWLMNVPEQPFLDLTGATASSESVPARVSTGALWKDGSPCELLTSRGIHRLLFVGDNIMRQLYLAALSGFMSPSGVKCGGRASLSMQCGGHLQPFRPWAPSTLELLQRDRHGLLTKCTARQVVNAAKGTALCRHFFARETLAQLGAQQQASFCGGTRKFQMEFVYGGIPETANISDTFGNRKWTNAEYPSILQANTSVPLVVLGFGACMHFNPRPVLARLKTHLRILEDRFNAPAVVWLAAEVRSYDQKHSRQLSEKVAALNSFIKQQLGLIDGSYPGRLYFLSFNELIQLAQSEDDIPETEGRARNPWKHGVNQVNELKMLKFLDFIKITFPPYTTSLTQTPSSLSSRASSLLLTPTQIPLTVTHMQRAGDAQSTKLTKQARLMRANSTTMLGEPMRHKAKAYIICLLGPLAQDAKDAAVMVSSLQYFHDDASTPLVIFHEMQTSLDTIQKLSERTPREVISAVVDFSGIPLLGGPKAHPLSMHGRGGWGYMHMINFFFQGIFTHPALADAEFVMRMDCDSKLRAPMANLFAILETNQHQEVSYVTLGENRDCGPLVSNLPKLSVNFAGRVEKVQEPRAKLREVITKSDKPNCLESKDPCFSGAGPRAAGCCCLLGYYNNFELLRLSHFRKHAVWREWTRVVTDAQGIYKHRWGDAILRRIGLELMNAKVLFLDQASPFSRYCHRGFCYGTPGDRPVMTYR